MLAIVNLTTTPPSLVSVVSAMPWQLDGLAQVSLDDLSAAIDPCPAEWAGKGVWPIIEEDAPLGKYEKHGDPQDVLNVETKTVTRTRAAVPFSDEEKAVVWESIVGDKRDAIIAAGYRYRVTENDPYYTYQIDAKAQGNMTSIAADFALGATNAHGGFWRDIMNQNRDMTDAQCIAFLQAAKDYKMAVIRRAWKLEAATPATVDVEAGTISGAGGWPANG